MAIGIVTVEIKCFWFATWSQKTTCLKWVRLWVEAPHSKSPLYCLMARSLGSRDRYFVYHVTLQDHVINGSCELTEGKFSLYITILPGLAEWPQALRLWRCFWFIMWPDMTTWLKGSVTLWAEASHSKSPPLQFWWP